MAWKFKVHAVDAPGAAASCDIEYVLANRKEASDSIIRIRIAFTQMDHLETVNLHPDIFYCKRKIRTWNKLGTYNSIYELHLE